MSRKGRGTKRTDEGVDGVSENELNDSGVFMENYGNGFMLADYREGDNARYCGSDLSWRRQPITYSPFVDKASAVTAGAQIISS